MYNCVLHCTLSGTYLSMYISYYFLPSCNFLIQTLIGYYTVHCIMYNIHCTLYTVHCTVYSVHSTSYSVHSIHHIPLALITPYARILFSRPVCIPTAQITPMLIKHIDYSAAIYTPPPLIIIIIIKSNEVNTKQS